VRHLAKFKENTIDLINILPDEEWFKGKFIALNVEAQK